MKSTGLWTCLVCFVLSPACTVDAPIARVDLADAAMADASRDATMPTDSGAPDASSPDSSVLTDSAVVYACTAAEIDPITTCGRDECGLAGGGSALSTCLLSRCSLLLVGVPDGCRDCLQRGVGGTMDEVRFLCAGP